VDENDKFGLKCVIGTIVGIVLNIIILLL